MSDDKDTKITSTEKPKDPKRVEAGKNLGTMSRQAKEKKASEAKGPKDREVESGFYLPNVDPLTAVGVVGVVGVVAYYGYNNFYRKPSKDTADHTVVSVVHEPADREDREDPVKPKRVYRQLDTLG